MTGIHENRGMDRPPDLVRKYDRAAPRWTDRIRRLGYPDAYAGFLAFHRPEQPVQHLCDIGTGTAAFAEAWLRINGQPATLSLVDPSAVMLACSAARMAEIGAQVQCHAVALGDWHPERSADAMLCAHLLEHLPDPVDGLRRLRRLIRPGGRLWIVVSRPHWCNRVIRLRWRHRSFEMSEMHNLLIKGGFRLDATYAFPSGPPSRTSLGYVASAV